MVKVLQDFEHVSDLSSGLLLIGPGTVAAVVGPFARLGGVGSRESLLAIAGDLSGTFAPG